jgi:hypothetical protein
LDCVNNAFCNFTNPQNLQNGTCTLYFSIPNGSKISKCDNNLNNGCKSGFCASTGVMDDFICVEAPSLAEEGGYKKNCSNDGECYGMYTPGKGK